MLRGIALLRAPCKLLRTLQSTSSFCFYTLAFTSFSLAADFNRPSLLTCVRVRTLSCVRISPTARAPSLPCSLSTHLRGHVVVDTVRENGRAAHDETHGLRPGQPNLLLKPPGNTGHGTCDREQRNRDQRPEGGGGKVQLTQGDFRHARSSACTATMSREPRQLVCSLSYLFSTLDTNTKLRRRCGESPHPRPQGTTAVA